MSLKPDFFYPFDKGFFGTTLATAGRNLPEIKTPSKLELDSVDVLLKYFKDKMLKYPSKLERSPNADSVELKNYPRGQIISFPFCF